MADPYAIFKVLLIECETPPFCQVFKKALTARISVYEAFSSETEEVSSDAKELVHLDFLTTFLLNSISLVRIVRPKCLDMRRRKKSTCRFDLCDVFFSC